MLVTGTEHLTQIKVEPTPSARFTHEPPLPSEAKLLSIKKISDYRGDLIQAQYEISIEKSEDYYHQFFRDTLNRNGGKELAKASQPFGIWVQPKIP